MLSRPSPRRIVSPTGTFLIPRSPQKRRQLTRSRISALPCTSRCCNRPPCDSCWPTTPGQAECYDAEVEAIAVKVAIAYEECLGAEVQDVSRPELARRAGLTDWPGFDLLARRAGAERRAIEVKGRAGSGGIEMSDNEWAKACNLRDGYWLYVVFDCATPHPRLVRVRDPFAKLLVRSRESIAYTISSRAVIEAAE